MRRELYWTPGGVQREAQALRTEVAAHTRLRTAQPAARGCALLVLDMQEHFLDAGSHAFVPSAPAIVPALQELMAAFVAHALPVILTRHVNTTQDAGQMATWWRHVLTEEDPAARLVDALQGRGSPVICKTQYDAFLGTGLEEQLRRASVNHVVIGGVMTHLCCESTARSAFMRGFQVSFLVDGTATFTRALQHASMLTLGHGCATLALSAEVMPAAAA